MTIKYLKNYLSYQLTHLIAGTARYEEKKKAYYALHTAKIKNKKLAALLEKACQEKHGILTYAEYLTIEQFSKYGYHGTHITYGGTPTATYWPKALVKLCKQHNLHSLVEFGPGEGALGVFTIQEAIKQEYDLHWSGIEIDPALQKDIHHLFETRKIGSFLSTVTTTLDEMPITEKSLFVFSYSLDSIPPLLFTNTTSEKTYPNALIGVRIKNQQAEEVIIPKDVLRKKHLNLEDGIFTNEHGQRYDLRSWQIVPFQRAYITIDSFEALRKAIAALPKGSLILIIDEFREVLPFWNTEHIFIPRDLEVFDRELKNTKKFFETAGKNIFYYLSFLDTYIKLFDQLGCREVQFAQEQQSLESIHSEKRFPNKLSPSSYCYAIIATVQKKGPFPSLLDVVYPQK